MKDYKPIGKGLNVLEHVIDLETGNLDRNVVIRKITEQFWQACIDVVDQKGVRYRVATVGSLVSAKRSQHPS